MIKSMRIGWAGCVARMGKKRYAYGVLVGKPLGSPGHRWEGNIKVDLEK
jgi:hypothetical protein